MGVILRRAPAGCDKYHIPETGESNKKSPTPCKPLVYMKLSLLRAETREAGWPQRHRQTATFFRATICICPNMEGPTSDEGKFEPRTRPVLSFSAASDCDSCRSAQRRPQKHRTNPGRCQHSRSRQSAGCTWFVLRSSIICTEPNQSIKTSA